MRKSRFLLHADGGRRGGASRGWRLPLVVVCCLLLLAVGCAIHFHGHIDLTNTPAGTPTTQPADALSYEWIWDTLTGKWRGKDVAPTETPEVPK